MRNLSGTADCCSSHFLRRIFSFSEKKENEKREMEIFQMKMFGYHFITNTAENLIGNTEGAIKHLAPLGVTHLVIEINNGFKFESHPEISSGDITAEVLSECCDKLRAAGIEPIPLYNCVGHQGWSKRNSFLLAYPEFDETPDIPDDRLVAKVHERVGNKWLSTYTPAWCSNEPKIYDVVLPAIDELIKASGCKTVHLGMDEIFLYGQCPRCEGMNPADLFRDSLLKFYNYYKSKGINVMIWGDRLLNATKLIGEGGAHRARYTKDFENVGTSLCIDELPKDIIICDWHYDLEETYPSASELLSHGYTAWPSCWFNPEAAETFFDATLSAAESLGCKTRMPGMLVTGWDIRPLDKLFTLCESELSEREQNILKTFPRIAARMKQI